MKIERSLLIIFGIISSLIIVEIVLNIAWGRPEKLNEDKYFQYNYIDIYKPVFERIGSIYKSTGKKFSENYFKVSKPEKEKRIFIIGESVAQGYDTDILTEEFKKLDDTFSWKVINLGVGGYDSYRVLLTVKKIMKYKPDICILMMGNNEGLFNPIAVNYLIYKYKILSKFWLARIVTNKIFPSVKPSEDINDDFRRNLKRIITLTNKNNIKLIVTTLPNNREIPSSYLNLFYDSVFLPAWLKIDNEPEESIKTFLDLSSKFNYEMNYFIAKCHKLLKNKNDYKKFIQMNFIDDQRNRNIITIDESKRDENTELIDLESIISEISGGYPNMKFMYDNHHFWPPTYRLISKLITGSIKIDEGNIALKKGLNNKIDRKTVEMTINENLSFIKNMDEDNLSFLLNQLVHPDWNKMIQLYEFYRYLYRLKPEIFYNIRDVSIIKWAQYSDTIYCRLGELMRQEGEFEKAQEYFNLAISVNKENPYIYLFRGLYYLDINKKNLAEQDFKRLKEIDRRFSWIKTEIFN